MLCQRHNRQWQPMRQCHVATKFGSESSASDFISTHWFIEVMGGNLTWTWGLDNKCSKMVTDTSKIDNWVLAIKHADCGLVVVVMALDHRGLVAGTWGMIEISLQATKIMGTWWRNFPPFAGIEATKWIENIGEKVPHYIVEYKDDGSTF